MMARGRLMPESNGWHRTSSGERELRWTHTELNTCVRAVLREEKWHLEVWDGNFFVGERLSDETYSTKAVASKRAHEFMRELEQ